ncbi:hypothetical protein BRD16_09210 [Halobacteriales archaeon SW_6_65_46]|nr:MAG: hypothetical protein BRD16_09210 [Halobacteriales archaeon SW_6_65_46]
MDYDRFVEPSQKAMHLAEIAAAYILVGLFIIGVADLLFRIGEAVYESFQPGGTAGIADPQVVVGFIDTALLLFIIVEIYQTVVAYSRDESVVRIVVIAALIAVSRKIISFRPGKTIGTDDLMFAGAFGILLLVLTLALYVLRTTEDTSGVSQP